MNTLKLKANQVLFGEDSTEGIVAVEPVGKDRMQLFLRHGARLETRDEPFVPFLLLEEEGLLQFKGLVFNDLHRLAIDIETGCAPGFEFSNPQREEDRILSIALMDNRGYAEVLFGTEMGEEEILKTLGERIVRLDPDVLEGHNLFNFDLEYIVARARMHGIKLCCEP
jgi:DNA polymerase elongation subunit (family B)